MTTPDIIGHFLMVGMLAGKWLVAHKHRTGWLVWACAAFGWIILGYVLGLTSLMAWNVLYVAFYLYSWRLWGRDVKNV